MADGCELCGAVNFRVVAEEFRGGRPGRIVECYSCHLVFQAQRADEQQLYRFYREEYPGYYQCRIQLNKQRHALLEPVLRPDADVLEIGCSSGEFLDLIRSRVRSVAGIELVPHDVETARERHGLTIYDKPVEELNFDAAFDIVMAFQTFEHIAAPNRFLRTVHRLLRPGGRLVLEVPNLNEPLLALYRLDAFRRFYFVPQHIYYYSQETLPRMLAKNGFVPGPPRLIQMGTLTNHLHWIRERSPQRDLEEVCTVLLPADVATAETRDVFEELNRFYVKTLIARGYSDTLWIESGREL